MSSPDSEILSKIITDEIKETYMTHIDNYHKKHVVLASNLSRLNALNEEREQLTQIIQQQKQELDSHIVSISNLLKTSLADNSKPHLADNSKPHLADNSKPHLADNSKPHLADNSKPLSLNYTDLHRMKNHNEDLNIIQAYRQDPILKQKNWKSKAFYDTLCAQYPVFDDLGNNTFKKVTLAEAQFYWRNKLSNAKVTPQDSENNQDDPGSNWFNSKAGVGGGEGWWGGSTRIAEGT